MWSVVVGLGNWVAGLPRCRVSSAGKVLVRVRVRLRHCGRHNVKLQVERKWKLSRVKARDTTQFNVYLHKLFERVSVPTYLPIAVHFRCHAAASRGRTVRTRTYCNDWKRNLVEFKKTTRRFPMIGQRCLARRGEARRYEATRSSFTREHFAFAAQRHTCSLASA